MKVTFVVYDHSNGELNLVKSTVKGNKPKDDEWEHAAQSAKDLVAEKADKKLSAWVGKPYHGTYSISTVLKGWVDFEDRAPVDFG